MTSNYYYDYEIDITTPSTRLASVKLTVPGKTGENLFSLPVWTPGSYLIREFPKHVINVKAKIGRKELKINKIAKHTWKINLEDESTITLTYQVYCHDLSVRTSSMSHDFVLLNLTTILMFKDHDLSSPVKIKLKLPKNWEVSTSLKPLEKETFEAENLDEAYDSPILAGELKTEKFNIMGIPHELAIAGGPGNYELKDIVSALKKIVPENANVFDGKLPYDQYKFLLVLSEKSGGGLEHKNSNVSMFPRLKFRPEKDLYRFYGLEAHEHFHAWNVKRIKPKAFMPYDYLNETYTKLLWVFEGFTSYYDDLVPVRARIIPPQSFLKTLEENINNFENLPGKNICSLEEASFNAWIGLYKPDENTPNVYVSYYLKGGLVAMLLDMYLRKNGKNLDLVMKYLWENYGKKNMGVGEDEMEEIIRNSTEIEVTDFFDKYIRGTELLPYDYLGFVGIKVSKEVNKEDPPFLGIKSENNTVKTVLIDSPAYKGGIAPGDRILSIDGYALESNDVSKTLKRFRPKEKISIRLIRNGIEFLTEVKLNDPVPKYTVQKIKEPTEEQKQNWEQWTKTKY